MLLDLILSLPPLAPRSTRARLLDPHPSSSLSLLVILMPLATTLNDDTLRQIALYLPLPSALSFLSTSSHLRSLLSPQLEEEIVCSSIPSARELIGEFGDVSARDVWRDFHVRNKQAWGKPPPELSDFAFHLQGATAEGAVWVPWTKVSASYLTIAHSEYENLVSYISFALPEAASAPFCVNVSADADDEDFLSGVVPPVFTVVVTDLRSGRSGVCIRDGFAYMEEDNAYMEEDNKGMMFASSYGGTMVNTPLYSMFNRELRLSIALDYELERSAQGGTARPVQFRFVGDEFEFEEGHSDTMSEDELLEVLTCVANGSASV